MRKRILVVNDNGSQEPYEQILGEDHRVCRASSEEDVIKEISKHTFQLLIIDVSLPGIKSLELLRTVRRLDSRIPVIMISIVNTVEMAVEAMKSGTNNYFTKPFHRDELKEAIKEVSDKYAGDFNPLPLDIEMVIDKVKKDMLTKGAGLKEAGENFEKELLKTVLEKANGDQTRAAHFLGIKDKTLSEKMAAFSIST